MSKFDHSKFEYDDPALPVFVTRITEPVSNEQKRKDFDLIYPIFANPSARPQIKSPS
jgi:hypothetical protein